MRNPLSRITLWWANQRLTIKGLVVVALPLAILLVSIVSLYRASLAESEAENDVRATFAIQNDIHQVHALLAEAAGGVRGYLLTGQEKFLQPYTKAEAEMPRTLARLRSAVRDAEIRRRLELVEALVDRKRAGLARLRAMSSGADLPVAREEVLAALSANKIVLDALRDEIDAMQKRESALLADRRQRADAARAHFRLLTVVSGGIGLLGSLAAVLLFSTGIVRRVHLLQENARRLERGEPLAPLRRESDEIGRLAVQLEDASQLLRAREQALRDGEERFRMVIEGVRDYGIFALSVEGRIVSWNAGAERIKGWKAEEILGSSFSCFYPDETRAEMPVRILRQARDHGRVEDEGWRVRKDGSRFWANVVVTALRDENGVLKGFSKVTRDITDRKRVEQELRLAREEAEAASQAKSEFLSRMSHELRTPLNAILGFAQLVELDEQELREPHRRATFQILKAGRHLLGLIDEVLDIARIEAGQMDLTLEPTDMHALVREAAELTRPIADARGVRIDIEGSETGLAAVCDRRRVVQVMLNLLSNAVKYNRPNGRVRVEIAGKDASVRVSVIDEGAGVDPADAGRLFTPFGRLGGDRDRGVEGTGLGLALSKRLVEAMDGEIGFLNRSPPDRGAIFWFKMPQAAEGEAIAEARAPGQVEKAPLHGSAATTILYVEDNLSNVQLVESVLKRVRPELRLLTAMQGSIGLALAAQHRPDLILLDLHLPDISGAEVLRQLKAAAGAAPPVIVISADAIHGVEARMKEAGAAAFLTKPIDVRAFLGAIETVLDRRAVLSGAST